MAPESVGFAQDDDFVPTISDNDADFPETGDGGEVELSVSVHRGIKRKRAVRDEDTSHAKGQGKSSQKLRNKRKARKSTAESSDEDAEDMDGETRIEDDGAMDPDFEFIAGNAESDLIDGFDGWDDASLAPFSSSAKNGDKKGVDIDELIARRRVVKDTAPNAHKADMQGSDDALEAELDADQESIELPLSEMSEDENVAGDAFGMGAGLQDTESDEDEGSDASDESVSEDEVVADEMPEPEKVDEDASSGEEADAEELARQKAFFAPEDPVSKSVAKDAPSKAFQAMSLSRPILRGLASISFTNPTPIQAKTIPVALLGKDVVGGAVTGSGKTAAFVIPILERLLFRPKKVPTSRVTILMPTRELAVQCFNVAKKLASFTDITFCLLTGGYSLREQEGVLRNRPDVIIATPGRFIDHMRNSPSFTVDTLEILVLDEADRMLEDGFADELNEILTTIPKSRQTMLFSATMTNQVDKLIRVGLNRPVRLMVDARKQTVGTLVQEFVRLRPGREDKRLGYLMHLCSTVFTERVIIFFRQRKEAHRVRIIFGLCGIKAAELHGSMSQEQRISSLNSFRNHEATHLLATDLASRGLDIPHVSIVVNYEAPQSHEIYLHRVGRTARAGRVGRSCTLAAETDRKIVKQAVRAAKSQGAKIASRVVTPEQADEWAAKVEGMEAEVEAILHDEKEEKLLSQTEMGVTKVENMMEFDEEIKGRPRRTWFESEKEKLKARKAGQEELNGRVGVAKAKAGGKLSHKDKKGLDARRERLEGRMWKKGKGDAAAGKEKSRDKTRKPKIAGKPGRDGGSRGSIRGGIGGSGRGSSRGNSRGGRR